MTPDERQLISGLFDRMRQNGPADKDREAESLINQAVRQTPDAAYLLVQSVLAQEHYLQEAGQRIQELEERINRAEDQLRSQQAEPQRGGSGGSFLGGLFGGGGSSAPQSPSRGSVPSFGGRAPASADGRPGSPWGRQAVASPQPGAVGQPPQAAGGGGGFMRSALATAAGVAGGMLAANAIQGMLGGGSSAHASGHPTSTQPSNDSSPFAVDSEADRQRELDARQDAEQDQELANDQSFLDDSFGGDDIDI